MDVLIDNIPAEMKAEPRWLVWELIDRNGKPTKRPVCGGKSNQPATWFSFDLAVERHRNGNGHGIAFCLGDGWVGLDFDDCVSEGIIDDRIKSIIDTFDCYAEISPSETGVKMICRGRKPGKKCKKDGIEIYDEKRFFCVTGQSVKSHSVPDRQLQLDALYAQVFDRQPTGNAALNAMLRTMVKPGENDGSRRLYTICCRAVEHNLTDDEAIATIREYEKQRPFPEPFDDSQIIARLRDAEQHQTRHDHATDMGNAERMAAQHGDSLRYVANWRKWLAWDGRQWVLSDDAAIAKAKLTARSIHGEAASASGEVAESLKAWAKSSESAKRVRDMTFLAQSEKPFPIDHDQLDADPWLLNVEDGTIELTTGKLREHRREDLMTKCCATGHSAEPPKRWLKFLAEIQDEETIGFLQRLIGSALVGEVRDHLLAIMYGVGGNGKSVLVQTIVGMLGDYASMGSDDLLLTSASHPTALADLFGKRFVAINETDEKATLSEARVKNITGGDRIKARRMREDLWEFTPSHTAVLSTNYRPIIQGTDNGIWRRVYLIPFDVTIPAEKQDKALLANLKKEWPSILGWAVQGCLAWQRDGLKPPAKVTDATKEYAANMDTIGRFLAECCKTGGEVKASDLYQVYRAWAHNNCEDKLTSTLFGLKMKGRVEWKKKSDANYYIGLKLAS
ncbi:phage/plasmid primase, P4 family [Lacipirellula sp.]|uniref:DNA primase family protein n=1 Tax=Lacipirellula sp. TaxID=2691419 RepID=UPI003D0A3759